MPVLCQCQQCGKPFYLKPSAITKGGGKYCSRLCVGTSQTIPLHHASFWHKVRLCAHGPSCPYCCWEWVGPRQIDGYGELKRTHGRGIAHRIAWEIWHNCSLPAGLLCCHYCHNRLCCNPMHLHPGTMQDNANDLKRDFRFPHGEHHWWSKLKEEDILQIFSMYNQRISVIEISQHFQVSWRHIYIILRREAWRHMPNPKQPV